MKAQEVVAMCMDSMRCVNNRFVANVCEKFVQVLLEVAAERDGELKPEKLRQSVDAYGLSLKAKLSGV